MHGIGNIALHSVAPAPQSGAGLPANPSGATFQLPSFPNAGSLSSPAQGISSSGSPALGSQTLSALLQTQDLTQTPGHGGGGGGGHHGGLKMLPNLALEEAVESEAAQVLRQRKNLAKTIKTNKASEAAEVDENGVLVTKDDAESATDDEEGKEDAFGSS
jgi:hypothetical protein